MEEKNTFDGIHIEIKDNQELRKIVADYDDKIQHLIKAGITEWYSLCYLKV